MTVLSRSHLAVSRLRRDRDDSPDPAPEPRRRLTLAPEPTTAASVRRRGREASAPQDRAVYTCECGYQFAASVSTSVDCPHCGVGQAW